MGMSQLLAYCFRKPPSSIWELPEGYLVGHHCRATLYLLSCENRVNIYFLYGSLNSEEVLNILMVMSLQVQF